MNIAVTKATEEEVEAFERNEWKKEDIKHYGREVEWGEWKPDFFIFQAAKDGTIVGVVAGHHIAGVLFADEKNRQNVTR